MALNELGLGFGTSEGPNCGIAHELKKPAWKDASQSQLAQPVSGRISNDQFMKYEQNKSMALDPYKRCYRLRTLLDIFIAFYSSFGLKILITVRAL